MENYTFVVPIKNAQLLSSDCLSAGSEAKFVGASEKCELKAGDSEGIDTIVYDPNSLSAQLIGGANKGTIQGGYMSRPLKHYSEAQVMAMRDALKKTRSRGLSDYSPRVREIIFKAIKKATKA